MTSNSPSTTASPRLNVKGSPSPSSSDLPGFIKVSPNICLLPNPSSSASRPQAHPRFIILFGWGDVLPRHIRKYTDGFSALFPSTPQIVLTTQIKQCMWSTKESRAELMRPILDYVYPPDLVHDDNVLIQTMSNTSVVFYAATTHLYEKLHNGLLPHRLLIFDSTPGNAVFNPRNVAIWGAAMALRISKRYKLPFSVAHGLCMGLFCANRVVEAARGEFPFAEGAINVLNDPTFVPTSTRRLYLYGKDDAVVSEDEIERHIAQTKTRGLSLDAVKFEGSNHVSHLRHHPEQYWAAIAASWQRPSSKL